MRCMFTVRHDGFSLWRLSDGIISLCLSLHQIWWGIIHFPSFITDQTLMRPLTRTSEWLRCLCGSLQPRKQRKEGKRHFLFKCPVLADEMVSLHKTKDPLGNVGCEAHMGKQAADELLTQASHNGLRMREREGGGIKNAWTHCLA